MGARRFGGVVGLVLLLAAGAMPASAGVSLEVGAYDGGPLRAYDVSGDVLAWTSPAEGQARVTTYDVVTGQTDTLDLNPFPWSLGRVRLSDGLLVVGDFGPYDYGGAEPSPPGGWFEAVELDSGDVVASSYGSASRYGFDIDGDMLTWAPTAWTLDSLNRSGLAYLVGCGIAGGAANVPTGPAEPTFPDVPSSYWAYDFIEYVVAQGMVAGYPDGTYHPYGSVTRAAMAVSVCRAVGVDSPPVPPAPTFTDVPADYWAYAYVEYLNDIVFDAADSASAPRFAPEVTVDAFTAASWVTQATSTLVTPAGTADVPLSVSAMNLSGGGAHTMSGPGAVAQQVEAAGGRIVWQDFRNGNWDIFMAGVGPDGRAGTADDVPEIPVTSSPGHETHPMLWGRYLVWEGQSDGPASIVACDLGPDGLFGTADDGGEGEVSVSAREQHLPSIGSRYVVWEEDVGTDQWQVFAYDMGPDGRVGTADDAGAAQLTTVGNGLLRRWPRQDNSRLLYSQGGNDLYLYDLRDYGLAPDFSSALVSGDRPLAIAFVDTTSAPAGHLTAWQWAFGDGATSTEQNPSHTYQTAGLYDVSLTVWSGTVSAAVTKTGYITVTDPGMAHISLDHFSLSDLVVELGCGDPDDPAWVQTIWNRQSAPSSEVDLDIDLAEPAALLPPSEAYPWFVRARDEVPGNAGFIASFEIERHGERYEASGAPELIPDDGRTVSLWIPAEPHNVSLTDLAVAPTTVPSGRTVELSVDYSDNRGHDIATWAWDDDGAGGTFSPSAAVQNPTYTTPANQTGADLAVTLTVTATCSGSSAAGESASATLVVTYDFDSDAMPDVWEEAHGLNPLSALDAALDQDNDGLRNAEEFANDTDPGNRDSDGDGFGDEEEVSLESDPADRDYVPAAGHFDDVTPTGFGDAGDEPFWAFHSIEAAFRAGIVQGYWNDTYRPTVVVTRDQMAAYIARALAGGDGSVPSGPAAPSFTDVGGDHWAYRYVEYCSARNVVQGYWNDTYHPGESVNRGQMAVYIARAMVAPAGDAALPAPSAPGNFPDVPGASGQWEWCWTHVEYCRTQGVVQGYWDGRYRPELDVTRDQMAVYVQRAFDLPM